MGRARHCRSAWHRPRDAAQAFPARATAWRLKVPSKGARVATRVRKLLWEHQRQEDVARSHGGCGTEEHPLERERDQRGDVEVVGVVGIAATARSRVSPSETEILFPVTRGRATFDLYAVLAAIAEVVGCVTTGAVRVHAGLQELREN